MLRHKGLLLTVLLALALFPAQLLRAQEEAEVNSHARIVRVSYIEGTVRLDNHNGYENVTMNVPISEGNRLFTQSDGWAEVQLEDGSTVRLAPGTQITFTQLARYSSGGTITSIDLDQGEAEFKVAMHDGSDFTVTARNKSILLKHSGRFRVTATNSDPLEVAVAKGEVVVKDSATGEQVSVRKNEDFALNPSDLEQYDLAKGFQADDLDQWSKQRDQYLSSYASNHGYVQSPYQYGLSDLNYYGQYIDVAGYGYCWQPYGVNLGWDPFSNGYWTWSPQFGYMWVSAYPWGWMPYRYGQWVFVSGYGWLWQPGYWNGWHTLPFVANAPAGFHPPTPPAQTVTGGPPPAVNKPRTPWPDDGRFHGVGETVNRVPAREGPATTKRRTFSDDDTQLRVPRDNSGAAQQTSQPQPQPGGRSVRTMPPPRNSEPRQHAPVTTRPVEVPRPAPAPSAAPSRPPAPSRSFSPPASSAPRFSPPPSAPRSEGSGASRSSSSNSSSSGRPRR